MTLRDLTEKQVEAFRLVCEAAIKERTKARSGALPINTVDAKLFFSDGVKAVLALITELPK